MALFLYTNIIELIFLESFAFAERHREPMSIFRSRHRRYITAPRHASILFIIMTGSYSRFHVTAVSILHFASAHCTLASHWPLNLRIVTFGSIEFRHHCSEAVFASSRNLNEALRVT